MSNESNKFSAKTYLQKSEKTAFALAAVAGYLVAGLAQSYLMYFLTDIILVSAGFVMVLMIVARIWDAINDPIMGVIIQRSNFKSGKMRPYVLIGSFAMSICCVLLFLPITEASMTFKMVYFAIMYLLFGMIYTIVDVPAMGLMSVSTPNSDERSSLLSFYVIVGTIGGLLPMAFLPVLEMVMPSEKWAYFALAVVAGIMAFVGYFTLYRRSKERFTLPSDKVKVRDMVKVVRQNKPMLQTLLMSMIASPRYLLLPGLIYIATYVMTFGGQTPGTAQILLYLIIGAGMFTGILICPKVYCKIGYKNTSILSALLGGIGLTLGFFMFLINPYIALPFMTVGGLGLGAYNVLPYPMVGESLDYLEWKTGERMEGVCFSLNSFVTKFNNAVGFIGLALGLIIIGFIQPEVAGQSLPQSQQTINGMFAMISLVPGVSFFLSILPMLGYKFHGQFKQLVQDELEVRRAEQHVEIAE